MSDANHREPINGRILANASEPLKPAVREARPIIGESGVSVRHSEWTQTHTETITIRFDTAYFQNRPVWEGEQDKCDAMKKRGDERPRWIEK